MQSLEKWRHYLNVYFHRWIAYIMDDGFINRVHILFTFPYGYEDFIWHGTLVWSSHALFFVRGHCPGFFSWTMDGISTSSSSMFLILWYNM